MANPLTKVVTGKCRFSYCNLVNPKKADDGTEKYKVTLLIPKSDTKTIHKMHAAIQAAADEYREKNGAKSLPAQPVTTLYDGDGRRRNGEAFGEECKGCMVITVSSKKKPVIFDSDKQEMLGVTEDDLYSGCYGRAAIRFCGYNSGTNKGISAFIISIQKLADGEPLSGSPASADDYDDDDDDYTDLL